MKGLRILLILLLGATACRAQSALPEQWVVISVPDQELLLVRNGETVKRYPVSTSKYGVGDRRGSYRTPLGVLEVASKIGAGAPMGAVFKGRHFTGEVLKPNAPGRDPIVTRILWLRGLESRNQNAYGRAIYIHGTPEERRIGRPASYGCVRMRSRDVADLFSRISVGTLIKISDQSISRAAKKFVAEIRRGNVSG